jgi:outer membrane receptor for ferrienterochelin and colicin
MPREIVGSDGIPGTIRDFLSYRNATVEGRFGAHSFLVNSYLEEQQKFGVDPTFASGMGKPQNMTGVLAAYGNEYYANVDLVFRSGVQFDWQNRVFPRDSAASTFTDVTGWRLSAYMRGVYTLSVSLKLEGGIEYDHRKSVSYSTYNQFTQRVITEANMKNRKIDEGSIFAQLNYESNGLNILGGTRYTKNQYFGDNVSSRVSAVYIFDRSNSVKIIAGQSFRTPSLFEVFYVHPKRTLGGLPGLRPERSESVELAYLTNIGNLFVQTLVYTSHYMDKIFRVTKPYAILPDGAAGTGDVKQYTNGSSFTARGAEAEARYRWNGMDAFVTYTYVAGDRGDTVGTNDPETYNFKYVPSHTGVLGCAVNVGDIFASVVMRYTSSSLGGRSQNIPEQTRVDLNIGFTHRRARWSVRHRLSIQNVLDSDMQFAEYVERGINSIPVDLGRRISYILSFDL